MTVNDLIEQLQQLPLNYRIVIASDEEGNSFNEAVDLSHGVYDPNYREFSTWTYDDEDDLTTERGRTLDESDTICIWP